MSKAFVNVKVKSKVPAIIKLQIEPHFKVTVNAALKKTNSMSQ